MALSDMASNFYNPPQSLRKLSKLLRVVILNYSKLGRDTSRRMATPPLNCGQDQQIERHFSQCLLEAIKKLSL